MTPEAEEPVSPDVPPEMVETYLRFLATGGLTGPRAPRHIGLAVSGGGDSVALLWLVAPWAKERGLSVSVATVDHGLRPEAAEEARFVAGLCREIGVPHDTLRWGGWDGRGNLQAKAREARRALLTEWAWGRGAEAVLLAHTEDDQAETFLMRLARGSGVDGLGHMPHEWDEGGMRWMRPLLVVRREQLRVYLRCHGRVWNEDPSNEDDRFARVRARRALAALEPLGLGADRVGMTAVTMRWASEALGHYAVREAERIATTFGGEVRLDFDPFAQLPYETQLRLLAASVRWVSSTPYRPRLLALQEAHSAVILRRTRTLQGALIARRPVGDGPQRRPTHVVIGREPRAASRAAPVPTTDAWDGRWRLSGPHAPGLEVRMLGEAGIALCPDWRGAGLGRSSVLASPAVWRGEELVAAPLAGRAEGWEAEVATGFLALLRQGR